MQMVDPLLSYLRSVKYLTDATNASLLVFPRANSQDVGVTLHDGEQPAALELENLQKAEKLLLERLEAGRLLCGSHPSAFLHCYASADPGAMLIRLSISAVTAAMQAGASRKENRPQAEPVLHAADILLDGSVWLGLQFANELPNEVLDKLRERSEEGQSTDPLPGVNELAWSLVFGYAMARQAYQVSNLLKDPVSHLPGRVEFQARLKQSLIKAMEKQQPIGLALINPDDFGLINHRLGRESGDLALRELAEQLQSILRQTDALFRYGGAVFGLIMQIDSVEEANMGAERIRIALGQQTLLNGAVRLKCSIGVVVYSAEEWKTREIDVNELMRRADRALNAAKLSGGGCTMQWEPGGLASVVENLDRLNGIFTADSEKDYRNMLLLWDMVSVITAHGDSQSIATAFADRLSVTFKPKRVGLFEKDDEGELQLLAVSRAQSEGEQPNEKLILPLADPQRELLNKTVQSRRTERLRLSVPVKGEQAAKSSIAYAVPLLARDVCLGCLYVDGPQESFVLDSSDLIFFATLANQVAIALDRAKLAARWKKEQEHVSRQLRQEVRGLRNALQHSRLVYRSNQMQALLDVLRRVAPTDATVLITGESGTGKEVLARTLHEQSLRHKRPFVTVDCGAIAQSLLEAELFGHVKGAFTGAQEASKGRIVQAEGGTLFLDEIGELPLEVQAKLLRFVQEKEFTPVGASASRRVDVRIVAATNRDLAAESMVGTFRRDLYYRLQVVTLTLPPLRERTDDILPLAYYFLEKYAVQNDRGVRRLSPAAEAALQRNPWTGNVRELQNRILQSVLMSDAEEIDCQALALNETERPVQDSQTPVMAGCNVGMLGQPQGITSSKQAEPIAMGDSLDPWDALREGLGQQVTLALRKQNGSVVPLGRWLTSDLVLAADKVVNGVARQASSLLGMAETTFRRQIDKARQESAAGLAVRSSDWSVLEPVIHRLVESFDASAEQNLIEQAGQLLLQEIMQQVADNDQLGSALLGVTKPTYLRRKANLPS
ncbi:MAG: sigma 54-interacting transcriptional regulator [Gammaproteobacteria bacterium]|nr:sigma 54-interacting transcriptional regulator [Gammaproteobacteria bacterium]